MSDAGTSHRIAAVLVAAGRGERIGGETPKQFQELAGRMLIEYAMETLVRSAAVQGITVVVPGGWEDRLRRRVAELGWDRRVNAVVAGGDTRQESVWNGLQALSGSTHVLIHDAVRPFVTNECIRSVTGAVHRTGAASIATRVSDTLMRATEQSNDDSTGGRITAQAEEIVDRSGMWALQTPQAFELALILEAHEKAKNDDVVATDDGTLVLRLGRRLHLVPGSWWNLKVTHEDDWQRAGLILRMRELPDFGGDCT